MKEFNSVGVKFLKNLGLAENGNKLYLCECPLCGNTYETYASDYYMGRNKCECKWVAKHNTRLYSIWSNMKTRCYNKNINEYKNYGGRGITVCEEWKNSFNNFYKWAIENGYRGDLSIDRKDVNGNYTPENCRWADKIEQANNKTTTLQINGMSLKKFCREHNMNYKTVHNRKTKHPELTIEEVVQYYLHKQENVVENK